MRTRLHIAALVAVCLVCACKRQHHEVTRGFYYWKTTYKLTAYEQRTLQQLDVRRMYVRMFDVDWNEGAKRIVPVAPVRLPERMDTSLEYVPVVFITQNTLAHLNPGNTDSTAANISGLMQALCEQGGIHPKELQIDCDWTEKSKDAYFNLLQALKRQQYFNGKTASCTIRMHQVKYDLSCGIPPVDKGLLMCYSMGNIKKYGAHNSILDVDEAKKYLRHLDNYRLPVDIALPVFQWCVLFHEQRFRGLMHDVTPDMVVGNSLFEQTDDNLYRCKKDTAWYDHLLQKDDIVRVESASVSDLKEIAAFTTKCVKLASLNVIFFSCDSITLSKYPVNDLQAIYHSYR